MGMDRRVSAASRVSPNVDVLIEGRVGNSRDPLYRLRLSRARNCPLEVNLPFDPIYLSSSRRKFWQTIAQNVSRLAELHLCLNGGEDMAALGLADAKVLDTLVIRGGGRYLFQASLPAGEYNTVRDLSLYYVALSRWDSPIMRGLKSLSLSNVFEHGPTVLDLLEALRGCPDLSSLELSSIVMTDGADCGMEKFETVALNALRECIAGSCSDRMLERLHRLFGHVTAPMCQHIELDPGKGPPLPLSSLDGAFSSFVLSALRPALECATSIHASIDQDTLLVDVDTKGGGPRQGLTLIVRGVDPSCSVAYLAIMLARLPPSGLEVSINMEEVSAGFYFTLSNIVAATGLALHDPQEFEACLATLKAEKSRPTTKGRRRIAATKKRF